MIDGINETLTLHGKKIDLLGDQITMMADLIQLNAEKIELNAKDIIANADNIQLNADKIELNAKEIVAKAELIQLNANRIEMNAEQILLKASKETVDEMGTRLSQAEINIDGANARIDLKASQSVVDDISTRLSQAEINIDGANARIDLKASQEIVADIDTRLSQAEIDIDGANAAITLKASQTSVDDLGEKVTAAELRIDGAESKITAQAKTIEAKADTFRVEVIETEITGLLKVESLQSEIANLGSINMSGGLSANNVQAQYGTFANAQIGNASCKVSTLTIGDKSCTFFAPSDATFDLSDMPGYDDALAAAKKEGASLVQVMECEYDSQSYTAPNKYLEAHCKISLSNDRSGIYRFTVPASSVYNAGESAGYSDGYASGYDAGESAGYSDGYDAGESAGYSAGEKAGAKTLSLSPSTSTSLGYGASQTVTASTSYGSSTVTKTVTITAPADRYYDGVVTGIKAARPTSASVSGTLSGDYTYNMSITCTNGTNSYNFTDSFSAKEAYDKGYAAAKDKYYDERGSWADGYEEGVLKGYDNGYADGAASVTCDYVSFVSETAASLRVFVYLTNGVGATKSVDGW